MTLIQRNAQQLREIALQNSKRSEENKPQVRDLTNMSPTMKIDIASMRKSVAEKKINNYLSLEVADEEMMSTLTHYSMIRSKERVYEFINKVTQRVPDAFTVRTTAEFLSDFINEYNIAKDIKENNKR
ncbi:MAG: hypothetical protein CBC04_03765 [Verrucomicrobia bacterium TMED44]|jgi:hypothetical protein|nr:MAG: hypothetical protein CBC04_03685 [Verrucomicrobia bacterium TMED44]OUU27189.1 MAG: hypothetical protein CBC04_03725 [Verrucomicrobia bacterium TMED44]OUU27196.1 MAG: hypothetical protein CBC04_03765 [Verrucomicrobia bacterium TMED44]|tara:strand:+ start:86 stop:469 length:384 start_codon:yes stop_codon:yes gene_type:complete